MDGWPDARVRDMLREMMRRTPLRRFLALLWAGLQLGSPAVGSLADANLAAAAGDPVALVESGTSSTCAVIHPADCAVCRYLSGTAPAPDAQASANANAARGGAYLPASSAAAFLAVVLPNGRAPPAL